MQATAGVTYFCPAFSSSAVHANPTPAGREDVPEPPPSREGVPVGLAREITPDKQLSSDASV